MIATNVYVIIANTFCKIDIFLSQKNISIECKTMVKVDINITIDDDDDTGYGYYCDPGKLEYNYIRPRINSRTGYVQYYNFNNPSETINEEEFNDIEHMYDHESHYSNKAFTDKMNSYTSIFIYGCIIVITFSVTSSLIHYKII